MDEDIVLLVLLGVIIGICMFGLVWCFAMLERNDDVYYARMYALNQCPNKYDDLPSYHSMMYGDKEVKRYLEDVNCYGWGG